MCRNFPPIFCRDCGQRFEPIDVDERYGLSIETRCQICQAQYRINLANQRHHFMKSGMQTEKPFSKRI